MQQNITEHILAQMDQGEMLLPALRAQCLGDFRLCRNEQPIHETEWKRKRARSLCAYLIFRQGQFIPRDQLIEIFWPELDIEAGQRNFAALLHLLRRILEPELQRGQSSRYLIYEHGGYRFDPECLIWSDIKCFEKSFEEGTNHHRASQFCRAAQAFINATKLYTGAFLSNELYEEWCMVPRRQFRGMYIEAVIHLSDYALRQGDCRQSLHWLNSGLREDNCHEELHQQRILLYQQSSLYNEALRCYQDYCEVMEEELDSLPSPQMRKVYEQLRTVCPSAHEEK